MPGTRPSFIPEVHALFLWLARTGLASEAGPGSCLASILCEPPSVSDPDPEPETHHLAFDDDLDPEADPCSMLVGWLAGWCCHPMLILIPYQS